MMRLVKDASNELGIIISSKKNVANGMTGYSIAHIEPNGLIDRWVMLIDRWAMLIGRWAMLIILWPSKR